MTSEIYQLETLEKSSETMLVESLKNKCIMELDKKCNEKSHILELSKRAAIPMPQRQHNESKCLGKKLHSLRLSRKISISPEEDKSLYESLVQIKNNADSKTKIITPSEQTSSSKKVPSSNVPFGNNGFSNSTLKRKTNEHKNPPLTEGKKRQKITWP